MGQRGTARPAQAAAPSRPAPAPARVTRAEREARYAGIGEPLRGRLVALLEEKERQHRDQVPRTRESDSG
ncbi:hypothetical protein [Streptacidiphilus sp. EB129]|uniref:hypothetical protein n=1 Tax=Streptacidiphilus sp. EB129 TaxID=3156262 RepID=UPI003514DFE9